jgi:hypothetical protein
VNRKKGRDATVDINDSNKGDPVKNIHHPGRCAIVGGHTGSSSHYKGSRVSEFQEFCS